MRCWETGCSFRELLGGDPGVQAVLSPEELDDLFDYDYFTRRIGRIYDRFELPQ